MFLILKTTDWREENYIKSGIVPFGWCEDNNRAIPNNEEVVARVRTEEQRNFLLEKLNNKYIRHLGVNMFEKEAEEYATENWEYYEEGKNDSKELKQAYLAGAEFGYNKANEWHYPSKGLNKQLTKAKELLTRFVMASVYFNGKETDLIKEAEQFLKEGE